MEKKSFHSETKTGGGGYYISACLVKSLLIKSLMTSIQILGKLNKLRLASSLFTLVQVKEEETGGGGPPISNQSSRRRREKDYPFLSASFVAR